MKIAVANAQIPFVKGGAEVLCDGLCRELIRRDHTVEKLLLPLQEFPPARLMENVLAAKLMEIPQADLLIALKFPAYLIPHPNKRYWIIHQLRQAYDLYGTPFGYRDAPALRAAIAREDTAALGGAKGTIYTISDLVSRRLWEANGIPSTPLYCPLDEPESFSLAGYGDYVFYPSRVNALKRQSLLVEAMAYTRTPVRLLLAGRGDSGEEEKRIMALIRGRRLQEKVTYENRFISQEEKLHHLARCLAVAFVPVEEDYGYITPEAFASHKAVLTCTDSGGPLAFVEDGVTGFVRPPEPRALARALDELYVHRERTAAMGQAAWEKLKGMDITWDHVVTALTSPPAAHANRS